MVKKITAEEKAIYLCEQCGYGYETKRLAQQCENYCKTHKSCSLQITQKAIYHQ